MDSFKHSDIEICQQRKLTLLTLRHEWVFSKNFIFWVMNVVSVLLLS